MNYLVPIVAVFGFYNITSKINNKLNLGLNNFNFSIFSFLIFIGLIVILITFQIKLNIVFNGLLIIFSISILNFIYFYSKSIYLFLIKEKLLSILFLFFSILTLIPIAGADSYAYHLAWPQDLIENPKILFDVLYLESRVVGIGEIVNYIGLILGTENLLSFLSFVVLFSYILKFNKDKRNLIILVVLSSPIYFKYLIDQKPFILPCIFLIIFIENFFNKILQNKIENIDILAFFVSLSFFANSKYPFLIIAFTIVLFFLFVSFKKNFYNRFVIFGLIIFIIHFLPLPLAKFIFFGDPFSPFLEEFFYNADQDILKLKEMYKTWDGFKVSSASDYLGGLLPLLRSIFNFFIPIAPFTILDTFGLSVIFVFLIRYNDNLKLFFILIIFFVITCLVFVTNFQSRWFLFIFLYSVLSYDYLKIKPKELKFFKYILKFVTITLLIFQFYYLANVLKDFVYLNFDKTLGKYVYLYEEIKEVENISGENYTLTNTRGNFFYKNLIQYKYKEFSKKNLINNKNLNKIKFGFFSTGTSKVNNDEIYSKTPLKNFKYDCVEIIYNKLNIVAKRNILSRKDYENFIFVKFKKPILECLN